jgi:serine/threonine protein kinase
VRPTTPCASVSTVLEPVRVLSQQGLVRVELARWNDRLVVVKRLSGFSPEATRRLEREADVVRKLDHENIVPLLATMEGSLVYAYTPGMNLAEALADGPLSVTRSLKILRDVLRALEHAHELGVIHCDVKPSNVLIRGERALLTDFGFAKDLALTAITGDQQLLGTPNYMAPEQFQGVRTDHRSDLYAAGAVLYHMLTGSPPYGNAVLRFLTGDDSVALAPLPRQASWLEPLVQRALAREPECRFAGATAMLAALHAVAASA